MTSTESPRGAPRYDPRHIDSELDGLLPGLPAIALEGPRGVGKTSTGLRRARTTFLLDQPAVRELLAAAPEQLVGSKPPVLIDEWQLYPVVWDLVRRAIDADPSPGRFLLTGSAEPARRPTHSGAGRIVGLRMRPLALSERGLLPPAVSLRALLSGAKPLVSGHSHLSLSDYADEIVRSGFPAIRRLEPRPLRLALDSYLARIVQRDFAEQGHTVRRPNTLRNWLAAYAAATATTTSYESIRDAASPGHHEKPAKTTVDLYREVLLQLWLLDPLPAWFPSRNAFSRLGAAPKHHLADPALAARLLGASHAGLLSNAVAGPPAPRNGTLLGALFESLVALSIRVLAQACDATVSHLRTREGRHEVDLIIQRDDAKVVALEVKLAGTVSGDDVQHLRWLQSKLGDDLLDAAVITAGHDAYRRNDGIAVIPAALIGP
ncbi:MAG: DUF4143 domain-containing protein [Candidatus Dormiibacterota bacterium]